MPSTIVASYEKLLKSLKNNSIKTVGNGRFYLSDRHQRTVKANLVHQLYSLGALEESDFKEWFERAFVLKDHFKNHTQIKSLKSHAKEIEKYEDFYKTAILADEQVLDFYCQGKRCNKKLQTIAPTEEEVTSSKGYWDSTVICPYCHTLMFTKRYPDLKIDVELIQQGSIN